MFFLLMTSGLDENIEDNDYDYLTNLYDKYGKALWKYAYKLSENYEIANDITSITFLKIIENLDKIRKIHPYKIRAYLMTMIKNTHLNYIKKEKIKLDFESVPEYVYSVDNNFTEKNCVSEIEEVINHMPEPYKSILIYRYVYEELSYDEIAITLNINPKNIRMYKKRAVDMLKQRLKGGEINHEWKWI